MTYPLTPNAPLVVEGTVTANGFFGAPGAPLVSTALASPAVTAVVAASGTAGANLSANTTYYYKVTAVDAAGYESLPSAEVSATTGSIPYPINLNWQAVPGAANYNVYRGTSSGAEVFLASVPAAATNAPAVTISGVAFLAGAAAFIDSGNYTPGSATPPVINATAGIHANLAWVGHLATANSGSAVAIGSSGTISHNGLGVVRLNPASSVTGVILQKGVRDGQIVTLINESANTVTFAAATTSNVADGTSDAIAASVAQSYVWDAGKALWYHLV